MAWLSDERKAETRDCMTVGLLDLQWAAKMAVSRVKMSAIHSAA